MKIVKSSWWCRCRGKRKSQEKGEKIICDDEKRESFNTWVLNIAENANNFLEQILKTWRSWSFLSLQAAHQCICVYVAFSECLYICKAMNSFTLIFYLFIRFGINIPISYAITYTLYDYHDDYPYITWTEHEHYHFQVYAHTHIL